MFYRNHFLFPLIISIYLELHSLTAHSSEFRPSYEGFYPIWEGTGYIQKHKEGYIGSNGADFGIKDQVQIGIQPILFMYRTPNAYLKFKLYHYENWNFSGQIGANYLLDQASRSFFSPMYSSRLDNPDFNVLIIPTSLISSTEISDWMQFHQTLTFLPVYTTSTTLKPQAYLGYSGVAEFIAKENHSILLHFAEIGIWNHDFTLLGSSYRFHNSWLEFRLGYFYRFRPSSLQNGPILGVGFQL